MKTPPVTKEKVFGTPNSESENKSEKTLDDLVTLKNIDIKIKKGEFTCIIGDVGSGKSSLLSTIIGDLLYVSPSLIQKYSEINGLYKIMD